ncbi:hypothetical protein QQF64_011448, partial [Cirrhinus molitorella]
MVRSFEVGGETRVMLPIQTPFPSLSRSLQPRGPSLRSRIPSLVRFVLINPPFSSAQHSAAAAAERESPTWRRQAGPGAVMAANMYRVGDYVYFENSSSNPLLIRRIEELNKTANGNVEAKVVCFYRRRDISTTLIALADKHAHICVIHYV